MKGTAPIILALITTLGFFFCVFFTLKWPFPESNKEIIYTMIGSLGTVWVMQMQSFFGTTTGSRVKDDTINHMVKSAATSSSPVTIPDANKVTVETKEGDINVNSTKGAI